MGGYGDYATPEQAMPDQPAEGPWEFCVTINDSWGYQKKDTNFKSARQCVRMLAECAGMGGNLLLDVGPKSDGTILPEQADVLKGLGRWVRKHAEALYGTVAGLPPGHFYGASTLNKKRDVLYLICFDRPNGQVAVKGIMNEVRRVSVVGGPELKQKNRRRTLGETPRRPLDRCSGQRSRSRRHRVESGAGRPARASTWDRATPWPSTSEFCVLGRVFKR